ncbi:type II secretion system protein F domain protein [mine drainage metagenome]|uniref:Type II secretion system protein F domain protein n=1 Tax=mine drainage metagenome TaxID=410659 RepID=T1BBW2_9ZZZZ
MIDKYSNTSRIEVTLQKAKIPLTGVEYLSRVFLGATIFIMISGVLTNIFALDFSHYSFLAFAIWFMMIVVYFTLMIELPSSVAGSRRKKIDSVLPIAMGYIATMASADVSVDDILYELSKSPEYGELAIEAKSISITTKLFGKDIVTAIKEGASLTPSMKLSEFLQGIITTVTSGGDLKEYFKQKALQYETELSTIVKRNTDSLSVMAESFIIVGVTFPLILMIIIGVVASLTPDPSPMLSLVLYLIVLLIIPVIAIMFALILTSTINEVNL